ncbi:MAG: hypothetical protein ACOCWG_04900 [bacterium]
MYLRANITSKSIETQGFKSVDGLEVFIAGYIMWENKLYWGFEFQEILIAHYKTNSIDKNINNYNGIFYFIITKKTQVTVGIDRYGFYPLMYKQNSNEIFISNSSNNLINKKFEWNEPALIEYLSFGFTFSDKTIIKDIHEFKPHRIYTINFEKDHIDINENSYWRLILKLDSISKKESDKTLKELINYQFDIYSDFIRENGNKIIMPISGGLDSRFLMNEFDKRDVNSMLITFGGNKDNYDLKRGIELGLLTKNSIGHFFHVNSQKLLDTIIELPSPSNRITTAQFNELYLYSAKRFNTEIPLFISGQSGGFLTGGHMGLRMKKWSKKDDVITYIMRHKTSPFTSKLTSEHKNTLYKAIDEVIPNDVSYINMLYLWEVEHRQRKMMARYSFFEGDQTIIKVLMPFYNYNLIDFFTRLRFDELLNQKFFIRCMKDFIYLNNEEMLKIKRVDKTIRKVRNHYMSEYLPKLSAKIKTMLIMQGERKHFVDSNYPWKAKIDPQNIPAIIKPYLSEKLGTTQNFAMFQLNKFVEQEKLKKSSN